MILLNKMLHLSGEAANKIAVDNALFFLCLFISLLFIRKNAVGKFEKWAFYGYTIISFSIYNIFIKPVQDYLITIPQTFIFYEKIISSLSLYDIFSIFLFLYLFNRRYNHHKDKAVFVHKNLLTLVWKRDLCLLVLSFVGYFLYDLQNNPVDVKVQVRMFRGILTGFNLYYISQFFLYKYTKPVDMMRVIKMFFFVNVLNVTQQFMASFFLQGISWERGGHPVVLFDQTESIMGCFCLPFIFSKVKVIPKWIVCFSYVFCLLTVYNYIKAFYLYVGLVLFLLLFVSLFKRRISKRILPFFLVCGIALMLFVSFFLSNASDDKMTRVGQMQSLQESFEANPANIFVGIGNGGLIKRQTMTEDGGEIRSIDLESEESKYQSAFQVPFLGPLKVSGMIGMLIVIVVFLKIFNVALNKKNSWYKAVSYTCFSVWTIGGYTFVSTEPQSTIFICEAYIIMNFVNRLNELNYVSCRLKRSTYDQKVSRSV